MKKTSIHFLEVKSTSEIHNFRKKKFDYCREDLQYLNEQFVEDSITSRRQKIEEQCKKYTGRKLQKNAKPIREGVVVIDEKTTIDDLKLVAENLQKELGIKVFQIFIHRDEGHYDQNNNWKTNQHAHLVAEWIDDQSKKMLKLNPIQMSQMQDICAATLGMQRGAKSSRKHLNSIEYKIKVNKEALELEEQKSNFNLLLLSGQVERKRRELEELKRKYLKLANDNRVESLILKRDIFIQDVESYMKFFFYKQNLTLNENIMVLFKQMSEKYHWSYEDTFQWLYYPEFYNKICDIMDKSLNLGLNK